jgi:hypothetical protein
MDGGALALGLADYNSIVLRPVAGSAVERLVAFESRRDE